MKKKLISSLLAFSVATSSFVSATVFPEVTANDDGDNGTNTGSSATQEEFAKFRASFLSGSGTSNINSSDLELANSILSETDLTAEEIATENARIVHHSIQDLADPLVDTPTSYTSNSTTTAVAGDYKLGDTRKFYTHSDTSGNATLTEGELMYQSKYTNVWLVDGGGDAGVMSDKLYAEIGDKTDLIYTSMTSKIAAHEQVVNSNNTSRPFVGDVDNDGKINILLYDLYGDGNSTGGYTAGYFWATNQSNYYESDGAVDCLHMDIGIKQGYRNFENGDSSGFFGTMAHEFQHMLFYSYLGHKTGNDMAWINESLSGVADLYFGAGIYTGVQTPAEDKFIYGQNDYYNGAYGADDRYDYDVTTSSYYGDFLSHNNSFKSYGMDYLYASLLHQKDNDYITKMYEYFRNINASDGSSNQELLGGALRNVFTNELKNYSNSEAFEAVYRLFMENYISDGGSLEDEGSVNYYSLWNGDKLWRYRGYYSSSNSTTNNYAKYSEIGNGDTITMEYTTGTPQYKYTNVTTEATREMMYEIDKTGVADSNNELKITVGSENNKPDALYPYVVLYDSTDKNGDVYPLTLNVESTIETGGRDAYLFVSTYYQDVENVPVAISWSVSDKTLIGAPIISRTISGGSQTNVNQANVDDTLSIESSYETDCDIQWYVSETNGDVAIDGATNSTFTLTEAYLGKNIKVGVKPTGDNTSYTSIEVKSNSVEVFSADGKSVLSTPTISSNNDYSVGSILSASPTGENLEYQWYTFDGTDLVKITGATDDTFTLTDDELAKMIVVGVTPTADNTSYTTVEVQSDYYGPVTESRVFEVDAPTISYTDLTIGSDLTAEVDADLASGYKLQWYTVDDAGDKTAITGATSTTFSITIEYLGATIVVGVTPSSSDTAYSPIEVFSNELEIPDNRDVLATPTVTFDGNEEDLAKDSVLTVDVATDITADYSTQWYTVDSLGDKNEISGATGNTFSITSAEIGATIVVGVTPSSDDTLYKTEKVFSTGLAIPDSRADFPAVAIAFADDKLTLTIDSKSVSDFKTDESFDKFTITWYEVDDEGVKTAVSGADSDSISIGVSDFGKTYIVGVTPAVDNTDYKITEAFSNSYSVEDNREAVPTPTITGNAVVGQELSMAVDFPSGFANYDIQWYTVSTSGDEVEISGATGETLTLTDSHFGYKIKVSVTPTQSNELYKAEETFSSTTATVEESGDFTSYTITLNIDDTTSTLTTDKDGKITLPATPTKDDETETDSETGTKTTTRYTFKEWNASEDGKGTAVTANTVFNEDTEIFAIWTVRKIVEVTVSDTDVPIDSESDSAEVKVTVPTVLDLESTGEVIEDIVVEIDLSDIPNLDGVGKITLSTDVVKAINELTEANATVEVIVPTNSDTESLDTTFDDSLLKDIGTEVTWVFDSNVTVPTSINLAVSLFDAVSGDISSVIKSVVTNDFSNLNQTIGLLNFSHNGSLGGDIEVQVDVSKLDNFTAGSETTAYLYKLTNGSVATSYTEGAIDEKGILTVTMSTCSDYLVTTSKLSQNIVVPDNSYVSNSTSTTTSSGNTYSSANYYSTGSISIPSLGYISEFRNILLGELINLDKIDVNGMEILGWYYDADFTIPVENTSMFVVTQAVLDGGLFPKFATTVSDTLIDGSVNAGYVDSLTDTNTSYVPTAVPSTIAKLLGKLF